MVTREGRVKILDFGLAKVARPGAASEVTVSFTAEPISLPGQVGGTVPDMAPEQIRGGAVDARTDLFALGILLYELVTGTRPFRGDSSADVSSAILRDVPDPLRIVREDLPPDVVRVIHRCLDKDPDRLMQTARDVRNELELVRRAIAPDAATSAGAPAHPRSFRAAMKKEPEREAPSIAVLPLASSSRDEEDEFCADGLADEFISVLGKIRGLRVGARTSSFQFKDKDEALPVIGEKLRVETVLEGSIRKSGDRLRVAVQLVKVADGFHLWTETYDRTLEDILAVQDDIARSVVKELRTKLLGKDPDSAASGMAKADVAAAAVGRGQSGEAHRLFLQGRHLVNRFELEAVRRGIGYLEKTLELEQDHAQAWAALAFGQAMQSAMSECPIEGGMEDARVSARRALDLVTDLVEGHIALGVVQNIYDWDWEGAEASFVRALEHGPGDPRALRFSAMRRYALGRLDEALGFAHRALEMDPVIDHAQRAWLEEDPPRGPVT
jgi:serine/threonine-protein kinase